MLARLQRCGLLLSLLCTQVHYYLPNAIDLTGIYLTKQRHQELTGGCMRLTDDLHDSVDQAASDAETEVGFQSLYSQNGGGSQVRPLRHTGNWICDAIDFIVC